jgi:5-methylcytosine-specific restriction enzyme subunit McrC
VQVTPTSRRGHYQLTPAGYVGTIVGPRCRLILLPKIPLQGLLSLFSSSCPPLVEDGADPGNELLDFLATRLAHLLAERAAVGLHRGYREHAERVPFLRGRLDVPAHLRDGDLHKDRLPCHFEEVTADVPCNQVPKATAERLLRCPLLGEEVRALLEGALRAYGTIGPIPLNSDTFASLGIDRLTEGYRRLLDLCRLLAEGLTEGGADGPRECPVFLLDLERIFERYVTTGIEQAFAGSNRHAVEAQPLVVASRPVPGQPELQVRPDVLVRRGGRPVLVVDAKWKVLAESALVTEDVYQVLSYCTILGVRRAVLVYPGRRNRACRYTLARAPVHVEIRTLCVTGTREACVRALRRLGKALRHVRPVNEW